MIVILFWLVVIIIYVAYALVWNLCPYVQTLCKLDLNWCFSLATKCIFHGICALDFVDLVDIHCDLFSYARIWLIYSTSRYIINLHHHRDVSISQTLIDRNSLSFVLIFRVLINFTETKRGMSNYSQWSKKTICELFFIARHHEVNDGILILTVCSDKCAFADQQLQCPVL